jgi:ABC-2 type transport system permease protein
VTLTVINSGTNAGTQLWYDRKNGMFEQVLMGPFTRAQYLLSIVFATLMIGIASSLLVFVIALPVLGGSLTLTAQGMLLTAIALFFGTLFFGGMALALSVALRSSETFQIVSQFAFFVLLFTSTIWFSAGANIPRWIQVVSLLNPLTYATDVFRAGLFNSFTPFLSIEATALAVEAVVMFFLAVLSFRRIRV